MNTFKDPFANMSGLAFFLWFTGGLALISLLVWIFGTPGKQIGTTYEHLLDNYTKDSSFTSPQFRVNTGQVYRLEFKNKVPNNSWTVIGIGILDEEEGVINEKEAEFWHESGRDSDGYWSERDDIEVFHFKAPKTEDISVEVYWITDNENDFWRKDHLIYERKSTSIYFTVKKAGRALVAKYFQYIFWIFSGLFFLTIIIAYGDNE
ncbi:hypothetical protein [Microscilla marina]|uniref:Uncharacterized protein n=1 Tax=Microscilla marina ATCC 23134 TaxID=313606 RepID=A1ZJP0_MICM2|nr:hypothetical protein [Microscilla marina]EAY29343.1 hypothetical protein M23134_01399 [Microscilla marina ATCC 23134]